jgi:hypothetical protein
LLTDTTTTPDYIGEMFGNKILKKVVERLGCKEKSATFAPANTANALRKIWKAKRMTDRLSYYKERGFEIAGSFEKKV